MHSSEITIFYQVNVDLFFEIWYDKYVGAAVGRSVFCLCHITKNPPRQAEPDKRNDP